MDLTEPLARRFDDHLATLLEFLRIPSVSTDPRHAHDLTRAADFLRDRLERAGFVAERHDTPGHPVVVARRHVDPSLPEVLIYGHYDVQPPDPVELWRSPPFEPTIRDGAVVARGASDDKGQILAHVLAAETLLATAGELPVNLTFLIEGEEEMGSPHLEGFLAAHRDTLAADVVLVSDSAMIAPGTPTVTYGLKGLCYLEVVVRGANRDLHSGAYGGGVPNPINGLARMIAGLHDDDGRVAVPGFYDRVRELDAAERAALARAPFDPDAFAASIGLDATPGEPGYTLLERLWARPTLDCNGVGGGFQGEGSKTVIPSVARAKISCRLVPDQEPAEIAERVREHLVAVAPPGLEVEVRFLHGGRWALTPLDSPWIATAAAALETVFGRPVVYARNGGTIPVIGAFQTLLGAEVVLVGFGLEDDLIHSPNEKFDLANYRLALRSSVAVLAAFGARS